MLHPREQLKQAMAQAKKHKQVPYDGRSWKGWVTIGSTKHYYKSKWEAKYARYLQWLLELGDITSWEYEPETFWFDKIKRGVCSYLPDFRVKKNDGSVVYYEVKGFLSPKSITKIKRMARYHPTVNVVLVQKPWFEKNAPTLKKIIPSWNNFE